MSNAVLGYTHRLEADDRFGVRHKLLSDARQDGDRKVFSGHVPLGDMPSSVRIGNFQVTPCGACHVQRAWSETKQERGTANETVSMRGTIIF